MRHRGRIVAASVVAVSTLATGTAGCGGTTGAEARGDAQPVAVTENQFVPFAETLRQQVRAVLVGGAAMDANVLHVRNLDGSPNFRQVNARMDEARKNTEKSLVSLKPEEARLLVYCGTLVLSKMSHIGGETVWRNEVIKPYATALGATGAKRDLQFDAAAQACLDMIERNIQEFKPGRIAIPGIADAATAYRSH